MARKRTEDLKALAGSWLAPEGGADEPTAKPPTSTTPAPEGGPDAGRRVQVTGYITPAELAALVKRAEAEDRSVAYVVRAAIRRYLDLS